MQPCSTCRCHSRSQQRMCRALCFCHAMQLANSHGHPRFWVLLDCFQCHHMPPVSLSCLACLAFRIPEAAHTLDPDCCVPALHHATAAAPVSLQLIHKRPLSPDVFELNSLQPHYKMPWGAMSSIMNRATGATLSVGEAQQQAWRQLPHTAPLP